MMKIWQSYGAEHSMKLVIIGKFKNVDDAEKLKHEVEALTEKLQELNNDNKYEFGSNSFNDDILDYLKKRELCFFAPEQLDQFLSEMSITQNDTEIRITSDDNLNALVSFMIHRGAKVEVFSTHDYPEGN